MFILVGCGAGGDRNAVSADGEALTRAELLDIFEIGANFERGDDTSSVEATSVRGLAQTHIFNVVVTDYFEENGVTLSTADRVEIEGQIVERAELINPAFIGSRGFEFWVDFLWQGEVPAAAFFDRGTPNEDLPEVLQDPPIFDRSQLRQFPQVVQRPDVAADLSLLDDDAFVQQLLASDPTILNELQAAEIQIRLVEIVRESGVDVEVETRLGQWDPEGLRIVAN